MKNNSLKLEYTHLSKDTVLAVSMSQNDRKITSDYLTSDGTGYDVSIGIAREILTSGLSVRGHLGYMKDDNDVTRRTFTTTSNASNINSDGIITGLGLGYTKDYNSLTFDFSVDASYYKANVDAFEESNSNKLDALSVQEQTKNGMAYKAKAKVPVEETWFNVENPGVGKTSLGLEAGAKYKIKENMSLAVDAGINEIDKSNAGYNTNLSFTYKF